MLFKSNQYMLNLLFSICLINNKVSSDVKIDNVNDNNNNNTKINGGKVYNNNCLIQSWSNIHYSSCYYV